ncbi:MAG: DUF3267 domain-containing protein [Bacteroidales bacterium]|nr:DUF3267 domain-containing protein [Bacteroidales bacterium]
MDKKLRFRYELTMNAAEANMYALIFVVPLLLLYGLPFYFIWLRHNTLNMFVDFLVDNWRSLAFSGLWVILILLVGVILHELIHGLTFMLFCKNGLKSISFGIMWRFITPYCHCKEPLKARHYIIGALMPAIIMGFLPACLGIITGKIIPLLFGLFFSFAAGGDFLIVWLLRKQPGDSLVLDHESKVGCYIVERTDHGTPE